MEKTYSDKELLEIISDETLSKEEYYKVLNRQKYKVENDTRLLEDNLEKVDFYNGRDNTMLIVDSAYRAITNKESYTVENMLISNHYKKFLLSEFEKMSKPQMPVKVNFDTILRGVREKEFFPNTKTQLDKYRSMIKEYFLFFILRIIFLKPKIVLFINKPAFDAMNCFMEYANLFSQLSVKIEQNYTIVSVLIDRQKYHITTMAFIAHPFLILDLKEEGKTKEEKIEVYVNTIKSFMGLGYDYIQSCYTEDSKPYGNISVSDCENSLDFIKKTQTNVTKHKEQQKIAKKTFGTMEYKREQGNVRLKSENKLKKIEDAQKKNKKIDFFFVRKEKFK